MKRSKFTDDKIAFALKQAETGTKTGDVCRKMRAFLKRPFTTGKRNMLALLLVI